jgi:hypothetical protein
VFQLRCNIEWSSSFSSYDRRYLITDDDTEIKFRCKKAIHLKTQRQVDEWFHASFCSIAQDIVLKLTVSKLPSIPLTPQRILQFIALFTRPQSHTVASSQYTTFLRHNILYYPHITAGLLVKFINFTCAVPRENYELVHITWLCLSSIIFCLISPIVLRGSKLWRDSD